MQIIIRDLRSKQKFFLDDAYLNGYAKLLGATATVVYLSLCRHADNNQSAFPSIELIAREHNISPRTVKYKLKLLIEAKLVSKSRTRSDFGKFSRNTYFLLDKSQWSSPGEISNIISLPSATIAHGKKLASQVQITAKNQVQPLHYKDSHNRRRVKNGKKHIRILPAVRDFTTEEKTEMFAALTAQSIKERNFSK